MIGLYTITIEVGPALCVLLLLLSIERLNVHRGPDKTTGLGIGGDRVILLFSPSELVARHAHGDELHID